MKRIARALIRGLLYVAATVFGIIGLVGIAIFVLSATDWGRERVRRIALDRLESVVHGRITIGRLSGNLLTGMTVHDVAITDSAGAPFVAARAVSARYAIGALIGKRVWLSHVRIIQPVVVLDRQPGKPWNYRRIFPGDTTKKPGAPSPPRWLRLSDVTVIDGRLLVRTAWAPSKSLSLAQQDSVVREALNGRTRIVVVPATSPAPGASRYQKLVEFRNIFATLPLLRIDDPLYTYRFGSVSSLRMTAFPFHPPAAVVTDLKGDFSFTSDSVWWKGARLRMPGSRISGDGSYVVDNENMTLDLRGEPAALSDLRWLYPRLPSEGQGTLNFAMRWRRGHDEYLATDARVQSAGTRVNGSFGLTLADTFTLHHTDLRVVNFDTRLIEQLVPNFTSPRRGSLTGRLAVNGGRRALRVDGDLGFTDVNAGTSRMAAKGIVAFPNSGGIVANNLRVQPHPLQVELLKELAGADGSLPISGTIAGSAVVSGSSRAGIVVVGDLLHDDRGARSRLEGRTTLRLADSRPLQVDAELIARPVSLVTLGRFAPAAGLRGEAVGPVRAVGTLGDLRLSTDLRVPRRGQIAARGQLDLAGPVKGYDLLLGLRRLNLEMVSDRAPRTNLTLTAHANGRGFAPATMQATIAADMGLSIWKEVAIDTGQVRITIDHGLAKVERLAVRSSHATANIDGTFGLTADQSGTLAYRITVDSLGDFDRWLPHTGPDTGAVRPRPAVTIRAIRRARLDSTRIARETEVERAATGRQMPRLVVDTPRSIPRIVSGSAYLAGTVTGNVHRFDVRGRLMGNKVNVHGSTAHRLIAEYAWTNARTPSSTIAAGLNADSISVGGFFFDSLDARIAHRPPGGRVELLVRQGEQRDYLVKGAYLFDPDRREARIADLTVRFDTTLWKLSHEALVRWRPDAIEVVQLELRNRSDGRIYANGLLPRHGEAELDVAVDNFQTGDLFDLLESDFELTGLATLHAKVRGMLASPRLDGAFGLVNGAYRGTRVPELHGTFRYANRELTANVDAVRSGSLALAHADAHIPVNLAIGEGNGTAGGGPRQRLLDAPVAVDINADSLPLELIPYLTDAVSDVHGVAAGRFVIRGTISHPILSGNIQISRGSVKIVATGATITNIQGSLRAAKDTIHIDSLVGRARGEVRLWGSLAVKNLMEPAFNLSLVANNAEMLHDSRGRVRTDANLTLVGPFRDAKLGGRVDITQGVIYAPRPNRQHVIGANDPDLFNVLDTAAVLDRELFPLESPLLENIQVDVAFGVARGTWLRSKEANVELYTEYPMVVHVDQSALTLTGTVTTERGEYNFLSKRFQISRGQATFLGTPDLNATLQVTGEFQVQLPNAPATNIQVVIGGTIRKPTVSLQSDAQPPRSQSELLSLLAFGQSTTSLLRPEGTSLASVGTTGDLVGAGAAIAMRRLTSVAADVLIDQLERELGRGLGADQFNITAGDVTELTNVTGEQTAANFFKETRIEAGKYLNPRTFVGVQEHAGLAGARVEYRTAKGWRYSLFAEPRIRLEPPTLAEQPFLTRQSYGAFIIREWRF